MAQNTGKFVCYYRVSTDKQGRSGLGIEAQKQAVATYLNGGDWKIVAEFTEIESGKRADRPKLAEAFKACRLHKATLVIAKLDRLSRNAHFLLGLKDAGIDFVCADMPNANRMTVGIMAMVAEEELAMISKRTKDALAASTKKLGGRRYKFQRDAKGEIVKDSKGNPIRTKEIAHGSEDAIAAAHKAKQARVEQHAQDIAPTIRTLQAAGKTSLRAIAAGLNEQGIPTARGNGAWSAVQVARVLERMA
jgi:DNA invertase Pin-like site-specific DNA recombinase